MTDKTQRLQQITLWLTKLALLTSGGKTPVTKQQIGLYATIFSDEVPIGAFSDASLTAICGGCEFFPAYAVLKTAVMAWWEAQEAARVPRLGYAGPLQDHFDALEGNDAHRQRVVDLAAAVKRSWQSPASVREALAELEDAPVGMRLVLGRLVGAAVRAHAPENLGFVPPEFHPAPIGRQDPMRLPADPVEALR